MDNLNTPYQGPILPLIDRASELSALGIEGDVQFVGDDTTIIVKISDPSLTPYVEEFKKIIYTLAKLAQSPPEDQQ